MQMIFMYNSQETILDCTCTLKEDNPVYNMGKKMDIRVRVYHYNSNIRARNWIYVRVYVYIICSSYYTFWSAVADYKADVPRACKRPRARPCKPATARQKVVY